MWNSVHLLSHVPGRLNSGVDLLMREDPYCQPVRIPRERCQWAYPHELLVQSRVPGPLYLGPI